MCESCVADNERDEGYGGILISNNENRKGQLDDAMINDRQRRIEYLCFIDDDIF